MKLGSRLIEIFKYKDLFWNLVYRNLKIKYKNSILGFLWSLLTPLLMLIIYTIVFSQIIKIKTNYPYPTFLLSGLLPWIFFQMSLIMSSNAILENANIIKKVYFPRELIPLTTVTSNMINLLLSFLIFLPMLLVFKVHLSYHLIFLPLILFLHYIFTVSLSLIVASLTVFFRDIQHILEIITVLWFYLSPIVYPVSFVPKNWLSIYKLNPVVDITELYRTFILYNKFPDIFSLLKLTIWCVSLILLSIWIFQKLEPSILKEL